MFVRLPFSPVIVAENLQATSRVDAEIVPRGERMWL